jgi:hypothetical protein
MSAYGDYARSEFAPPQSPMGFYFSAPMQLIERSAGLKHR